MQQLCWKVQPHLALDSAGVLDSAVFPLESGPCTGPLFGNLALDSAAVHLATTGRWARLGNLAVNDGRTQLQNGPSWVTLYWVVFKAGPPGQPCVDNVVVVGQCSPKAGPAG